MNKLIQRAPDLRAQIFDRLRERINRGDIGHDERLTEMTVAKQYDVSRTPAREALALLDQAGLVVQDQRGYRIPVFSRKDIDDVFEVRYRIEPYAIGCICRQASDAELKALGQFAKAEFKRDADGSNYSEVNRRVRLRLFQLLRNEKLHQLINLFEDRIAFIRVRTLQDPAIRRISSEGNQKLIAAVVIRDAEAAEKQMHYLLDEAHKATVALL